MALDNTAFFFNLRGMIFNLKVGYEILYQIVVHAPHERILQKDKKQVSDQKKTLPLRILPRYPVKLSVNLTTMSEILQKYRFLQRSRTDVRRTMAFPWAFPSEAIKSKLQTLIRP